MNATCTACAAGTNALGDAFSIIRRGDATAMFAGGAEAAVNQVGMSAFAALRALSSRNDEPERASRPFDAGRDGFVMGEGGGVLVLEELGARASPRSAHICRDGRIRDDRRRLPSHRARRDRGTGRLGDEQGHPRRGRRSVRGGLHQCARHLDSPGRRHGDQGHQAGAGRPCRPR